MKSKKPPKTDRSSSSADGGSGDAAETSKRPKSLSFGRIVLVLALAAAFVVGFVWWSERPVRRAEQALDNGEFKYAQFLADGFLEDRPHHTQALSIRARALMAQQLAPDEVLRIFDEIKAATGEEMLAWAQAFLLKSQWSEALPLLEQAVQMLPTNAEALYSMSICRIHLGRQKEALESAERLVQLKGYEARAYVLVGTLHGDLGNLKEAAEAMAAVLKYEPEAEGLVVTPAEFFLQYGSILLQAGQPEAAIEPLKRSVNADPSAEAFAALGNAASELGRTKDAGQAWTMALRYSPNDFRTREALANVALQDAKFAEALDWLKPLVEVPGMKSSTSYLLQRCYAGLKDDEGVRKWTEITATLRKKEQFRSSLDAMISDNPDAFWARTARTHDYASMGNWEQAEALLPGLLKDAPGDKFIIELADAVRRRATLPSIEQIPILQH